MMKKLYTKEFIIDTVKRYDVRAKNLTEPQIDDVINIAFAEVTSLVQAFSNEEIVALDDMYSNGETKFTLDIEEDVTAVYDAYVTIEDKDFNLYEHGIKKIRDKNVIYQDNRYAGRVHIDLGQVPNNETCDNVIIKYYYTPIITSQSIYMDQQTWLAFTFAIGTSLYDFLHDVERSMQKKAGLMDRASKIIPELVKDSMDPGKESIFPFGV